MDIKVSTENGRVPVTIMQLSGNIDSSNFSVFESKADQLIKDGTRYILIDLSNVPFLSSSGLRVLLHIFNELRALHPDSNLTDDQVKEGISAGTYKSPHMKLLNLSKQTEISFKTAGFDMFLETYNDLKTAIASF